MRTTEEKASNQEFRTFTFPSSPSYLVPVTPNQFPTEFNLFSSPISSLVWSYSQGLTKKVHQTLAGDEGTCYYTS